MKPLTSCLKSGMLTVSLSISLSSPHKAPTIFFLHHRGFCSIDLAYQPLLEYLTMNLAVPVIPTD